MRIAARMTRFSALRLAKFSCSSETSACGAPKCVRVLTRAAIVSVMLIKSNTTGVRWVERDVSRRAPDKGARLY
jgi:hypothetical protein